MNKVEVLSETGIANKLLVRTRNRQQIPGKNNRKESLENLIHSRHIKGVTAFLSEWMAE